MTVPAPRREMPTFEDSRREAYKLLGDAANELRMGDWTPPPSAEQRAAVIEAQVCIRNAKAALNRAAR